MTRIALISYHSSPYAPLGAADTGGMNLYIREVAEHLALRGMNIDILTRRDNAYLADVVETPAGARLIHIDAGPPRDITKSGLSAHVPAFVAAVRQRLQREGRSYDLVHTHYWLSGLAGMALTAGHNVPLVHMFHTLARVKEFYQGETDPRDTLTRRDEERRLIESVDLVVGATQDEVDLMRRLYGVSPRHFAVVPPGVDLNRYRSLGNRAARARLGIDARTVALFVGRMDRIKGLDSLFRIVAERPERFRESFELVVVGGAQQDDGATKYYRHLAETLHIDQCVRFVGSVDAEVLPLYYSAADLCVLPSAHESFGIVALESMACETPVVAYRVGGPSTTIVDGQTGFLATPGSSIDYARKLWAALSSADLLHMGRLARRSVKPYAWELIADRTEALYRHLLAADVRAAGSIGVPPRPRRCLGAQPLSSPCAAGAWKCQE